MDNTLRCPYCNSDKCYHLKNYETKENGSKSLHLCTICNKSFSETKGSFLAGLKKPISLIVGVFKARTDGLSFNATCRVFNIAKNTLLDWERKFQDIKPTLLMYAILNTFISSKIIEGDELYTKIDKNVPVEECEGWTILLMERATRFIWALGCGKKDRTLFYNALHLLRDVIKRTGDVTLVTDGERRYGKILFEICHDVVHNGKRGRPPKVLLKGVKVRLKNKGDRSSKKKLARQKYEAPQNEHPQTIQNVSDSDIHANHAEAFNSSIRRKNSAYRRKTNTYAKSTTGLQRTLDIYWIAHNFIFEHFTTKQVPAVALGILKEGLSWGKVFQIRKPYII